uniref:Uncharacterized protein n=1 Tax=Rhizophora mucronata TaxID=61149 RepID=A0A2P2QK79_RHIMU
MHLKTCPSGARSLNIGSSSFDGSTFHCSHA